jgi:hypothetical protein
MYTFQFRTKVDQTILLGKMARNIPTLLENLRTVPDSSVYYHTHRFLQQHHYLSPEPPNDFAYWVTEVLNDQILGEQLSSVDTVQFRNIGDLRGKFVSLMETRVAGGEPLGDCPKGQEFHFMAAHTFVLPTSYEAHSLKEFGELLGLVSVNSLYYHMFDAKLRLERDENDFSRWFEGIGQADLAREVRNLDPYTYTLEGLRKRIMVLVKKHDAH